MKTNKRILLINIFIVLILSIMPSNVLAYQSTSKGTPPQVAGTKLITGIREMEASGAGMGLNESYTSTSLLPSGSNNIDVHMEKNTEYGAVLILSVSQYGKEKSKGNMQAGERTISGTGTKASTTGNVYGAYEMGYYYLGDATSNNTNYYEMVAASYVTRREWF